MNRLLVLVAIGFVSNFAFAQQTIVFSDSLCNFSKLGLTSVTAGEYALKVSCDTLFLVSKRRMQIFRLQDQLLTIASKKQDITGNLLTNYQTALRKNDEYYEALYSQYSALDKSSTAFSAYTKENLQQASDTLAKVSQTLKQANNQIDSIEKAVKEELKNARKEKWRYGIVGVLLGGAITSSIVLLTR